MTQDQIKSLAFHARQTLFFNQPSPVASVPIDDPDCRLFAARRDMKRWHRLLKAEQQKLIDGFNSLLNCNTTSTVTDWVAGFTAAGLAIKRYSEICRSQCPPGSDPWYETDWVEELRLAGKDREFRPAFPRLDIQQTGENCHIIPGLLYDAILWPPVLNTRVRRFFEEHESEILIDLLRGLPFLCLQILPRDRQLVPVHEWNGDAAAEPTGTTQTPVTPVPTGTESIPQPAGSPMTAVSLSIALQVPDCSDAVDMALRRLANKDPAVFTPNPDPRHGQPTRLYHTPLVWTYLLERLPKWKRLQAGKTGVVPTQPTKRRGPRNLKKIFT